MAKRKADRTRPAANKRRSTRVAKSKRVALQTADQFFTKSEEFQDRWNRATHVLSKMRADGVSLRQAAREFEIDPRTVVRWGGSGLRKRANGLYAAKASDRLLRVLVIPAKEGLREVAVRDSRAASEIAKYSDAVQRYLQKGDRSAIRGFRRKRITDADGARVPLVTDLDELDRLGSAGVLSFESLYARSA